MSPFSFTGTNVSEPYTKILSEDFLAEIGQGGFITVNFSSCDPYSLDGVYSHCGRLWIDWDGDFVFDDDEGYDQICQEGRSEPNIHDFEIIVPSLDTTSRVFLARVLMKEVSSFVLHASCLSQDRTILALPFHWDSFLPSTIIHP